MSLDRLEPVPIESLPVFEESLPVFESVVPEALEPEEPVVSLEAEPLPVPPSEPELEPVEPLLESSLVVELEELGAFVVSELVELEPVPYFELEEPVSGVVAPGELELLPPIRSLLV